MVVALKQPPGPMTVAAFLTWDSGDRSGRLWQLRDGEPEMMTPASDAHGTIQMWLGHLLTGHLERSGSPCRAVANPGVVPTTRPDRTMLVPDIGVTCDAVSGHAIPNPVLLIEILSPSNTAETQANIETFKSIPSVAELLIVYSNRVAAELWRRNSNGGWPERPTVVAADGVLRLDSIGFAVPLRDVYRASGLISP